MNSPTDTDPPVFEDREPLWKLDLLKLISKLVQHHPETLIDPVHIGTILALSQYLFPPKEKALPDEAIRATLDDVQARLNMVITGLALKGILNVEEPPPRTP